MAHLEISGRHAAPAGWRIALLFLAVPLFSCRKEPASLPAAPQEVRLAPDEGVQFAKMDGPILAVSPDGATVVFCGESSGKVQLYSRKLAGPTSQPIAGTADASAPFFSPDGKFVGFFADGKLKRVPPAGGEVITLADAPAPRGGTWTRADKIYYSPANDSGLFVVPTAGGEARQVTTPARDQGEFTHRWPSALPGGEVIYTVGLSATPEFFDDANLEIYLPQTGKSKRLNNHGTFPRYSSSGHMLIARAGVMIAVPFSTEILLNTAVGFPMTRQLAATTPAGAAQFDVAQNGTIVYIARRPQRPGS